MNGVRVRREGWEGKCDACLQWWPLTGEFWYPRQGTRRCKACMAEAQHAKNKIRRMDPAVRQADTDAMKAYRRANRDILLEQRRAYYAANREKITAQRRAKYAADSVEGRRRQYKRDWMRAHRTRLRAEIAEGLAAA